MSDEPPYLFEAKVVHTRKYNPKYGDDRLCICGHPYHRHFDWSENYQPTGCKHCECYVFMQGEEDE
jgi:hypothetical protein